MGFLDSGLISNQFMAQKARFCHKSILTAQRIERKLLIESTPCPLAGLFKPQLRQE
jgi:hypothetical protein